jgi:hypothetical protein
MVARRSEQLVFFLRPMEPMGIELFDLPLLRRGSFRPFRWQSNILVGSLPWQPKIRR